MDPAQLQKVTSVMKQVEAHLAPLDQWAARCHGASIELVNSGLLGTSRVARGSCQGVAGQHSWVILGMDCYDDQAVIVDPTLWSYDDEVKGIWVGTYQDGLHRPHGKGSIWEWGRPNHPEGLPMRLTPREPFSGPAKAFLDILGPLDEKGWIQLAHAPVEFWPAAEIIDAIYETDGLAGYVPIDIIGMLTNRNPKGLYLPEGDE